MPLDATLFAPDSPGIRVLDPCTAADWDARIAPLPGAGFFHSAAWAKVLHATYGYQPAYLGQTDETGQLRALLPLMEVDSWLTGRRGVALPFTDEAAPLCPDAVSCERLFTAAKKLGAHRRWKYLELRGGRQWLPFAPPSTSFYSHRLALEAGEAALHSACEDSVRRAIRKAERNHLDIEFSQSLASMREFYRLMCQTRRRHGVPPQPFPFFAAIQRHVLAVGQGWIVLVRQGTVPVAGAVYFHFGRHAIYKYGASDESKQQLRANNLVMWRAIQHYAKAGFASLDFGRTSLANAGLRQFKLGWGTREELLDYVRYDLSNVRFASVPDTAHGWHNRVFQALPLPLFRLAGNLLYRHMG